MKEGDTSPVGRVVPPRGFFMSLRDIAYWVRNARADAALARFHQEHAPSKAFDLLYQEYPDPWESATPCYRYQRLKYDTLLSFTPPRRYSQVLDIGCGLGVLSRRLSTRAEHVLGVDLSGVAIERARQLSHAYPNVRFEQADLLDLERHPGPRFDLVVLAEVLYYLSPLSDDRLKTIARIVGELLAPGGILLLVNHFYFGLVPASRMTRQISDAFRWSSSLQLLYERWRPFYLASIFTSSQIPHD